MMKIYFPFIAELYVCIWSVKVQQKKNLNFSPLLLFLGNKNSQ